MTRRRPHLPAVRLAALGIFLARGATMTADARADNVIAEEVVARVDGHPILLSEIRARARPRLAASAAEGVERVKKIYEIYAEVLEQRIEEQIVRTIGASLRVVVPEADMDAAIAAIATRSHLTREELLAAALLQGFPAQEYRAQLRTALVRHKVLWVLGARDRRAAPTGKESDDAAATEAWLARVEAGPFGAAKRRVCVERLVRW